MINKTIHDKSEHEEETAGRLTEGLRSGLSLPRTRILLVVLAIIGVALVLLSAFHGRGRVPAASETLHAETETDEVVFDQATLDSAGIETREVVSRSAHSMLCVTGSVEANQQLIHQITPLVSGRVESVRAALGDRVKEGDIIAVISSPQAAEMHGRLHEGETRLALAERNLERVMRAENRAAVLTARARLDEAEATLKRTKRLVELGAGAGKDLLAAETAERTARAEYEFQSNIALSKEVSEARAELEKARVDLMQARDGLRAMGAAVVEKEGRVNHDVSLISLRSPVTGTIVERLVNSGAGVEAGKPLFTVANLSTVWVIANVPEADVAQLRVGAPAEVRLAGQEPLAGQVAYIDPMLNEETRTARLRIELRNPGEKLKVGMFVEVDLKSGSNQTAEGSVLSVPDEAVQRINDRTVVFMPKNGEPGRFVVRDVEVTEEDGNIRSVIRGLAAGDRVVTKGSFALKSRLLKSEMKGHED